MRYFEWTDESDGCTFGDTVLQDRLYTNSHDKESLSNGLACVDEQRWYCDSLSEYREQEIARSKYRLTNIHKHGKANKKIKLSYFNPISSGRTRKTLTSIIWRLYKSENAACKKSLSYIFKRHEESELVESSELLINSLYRP